MTDEMVEKDRFWLVLREPGKVPERKGPWRKKNMASTLREFIGARPAAYIDVLTINCLGEPDIDHGPEVLQIMDARSIDTGAKHNHRTREAHAPYHARAAITALTADAPKEVGEMVEALRTHAFEDCGAQYVPAHIANQAADLLLLLSLRGDK